MKVVSPMSLSSQGGSKRGIDEVYAAATPPQSVVSSPISQVFSPNYSNSQSSAPVVRTPRPTLSQTLSAIFRPRPETPPLELEPPTVSSSPNFFNSGETVITFGNTTDYAPSTFEPDVQMQNGLLKKSWTSMMDTIYDCFRFRRDFSEELAYLICEANNLPRPVSLDNLPVENAVYIGKIVQDIGRLDSTDLQLEAFGDEPRTEITLDISEIKEFSVFPGQVVAFRGVSRGNSRIAATNFYTGARGPRPPPPNITAPFSMMIAAGPFTPLDFIDKTFINGLIQHARTIRPALLFLIGPFTDPNSVLLSDPNIDIYSNKTFRAQHAEIMEKIAHEFAGLNTKVYYITSSKDNFALPVYPTPINLEQGEYTHGVLPDPVLLNINGLIMGLTASDILMYLSYHEFSNCKGGNRLARLAGHLINQQSFYPLETGPFDESYIDYTRIFHYARIPVVPHILVLPSSLGHFIKEVDNCVVVNPEKCVKGRRGNNFALIEVRNKRESEVWSPSTHISGKIVRI